MTSRIMKMAQKAAAKQQKKSPTMFGYIAPHLSVPIHNDESHGYIRIQRATWQLPAIYISKKKPIFKILSRLDWVHYDPIELANAINNDTIEDYYSQQLSDPRSYPNDWKRPVEEIVLKTHYANRVGRPTDLLDNL
tara:strand:- start:185 stop:592 length:408 start_codon:yes stop_codon:yes gene_type:complete